MSIITRIDFASNENISRDPVQCFIGVREKRRKGDPEYIYSYRDFTVGGGAVERTGQGCHWQVNPGGAGIVGQTTPVPRARSTDARGRGNAQLVRLPATPVSRG